MSNALKRFWQSVCPHLGSVQVGDTTDTQDYISKSGDLYSRMRYIDIMECRCCQATWHHSHPWKPWQKSTRYRNGYTIGGHLKGEER